MKKSSKRFDILTIFPQIYDSYFNESILRRAREQKFVDIHVHNLRDFKDDKHRKVDDRPYGGGAGMVLLAEPILKAVSYMQKNKKAGKKTKIAVLSAKGRQYSQKIAADWAKKYDQVILINGRYEGIDERVVKALHAEEISMGPYIVTDGDVASMAVVSSITRLIPGVIRMESLQEESYGNPMSKQEKSRKDSGELEYPHYTRPEVLEWKGKKYRVPKVLLSGDHKKIDDWRKKQMKDN